MFFTRSKVDGLVAGASFFLGLSAGPMGSIAQSVMPARPPRVQVASEAVAAAFRRADEDNDGMLTREESAHLPAIYAHFDELDTNHDGLLSLDEFSVWLNNNQ